MTAHSIARTRFAVLGGVRAWHGAAEVTPPQQQRRSVLAFLLLRAGSCVSPDELIEAVWNKNAPASARTVLHTHIHHLRRSLQTETTEAPVIGTVGRQYRMDVADDSLDVRVFRRLTASADTHRAEGRGAEALEDLRTALALWKGRALDDLSGAWAEQQRGTLEALRLTATEARIALELQLGTGGDHVAEVRRLVSEHPFDERFRELLMLALYRSGRRREALDVYDHARRALGDQLGVDPGPSLRRLRRRILTSIPADAPGHGRTTMPMPLPPRQLPPLHPFFCGRSRQLAEAEKAIRSLPEGPRTVAVQGGPGMGKSALAVALAHRLAPDYPDGQLYAALRGSERPEDRTALGRAVTRLLRALGATPLSGPDRPETLAAQFREVLATRRAILLLDDPREAGEVRDLLPTSGRCLVIVTGRSDLSGLLGRESACRVTAGPLSYADAHAFLVRRIGAERTGADPHAVDLLVKRCGGVPAALALAAARAVLRRRTPLSRIALESADKLFKAEIIDPSPK
ncbi:BTAD domain-containing putative transcriptional regulator [Streptomyces sp. NPDC086091]|uniref:AfsR/SARP family transcriptional regulator n=1 Tax=Streptomyces sp. NPDC086091 TaxID=3365751 RepID=UPI00380B53BA